MNVLHHSIKLAKLMATLSKEHSIPDLESPTPRNLTVNDTSPGTDRIVSAKDTVDLQKKVHAFSVLEEKG